jgi:hemerythrin superfamily protein
VALLRADHGRMRKLLDDLQSAKSPGRQISLIERVEDELKTHTALEEKFFYPAFLKHARSKEDRQMYHEALEEHHAVDVILPEVKTAPPGTAQFAARAKVLKELVEHHAGEEEKEMFPRARKIIGSKGLREIGQRIAEKQAAGNGVMAKMASFLGMA